MKNSHDLALKGKERLENDLNCNFFHILTEKKILIGVLFPAQKDLLMENKHMVCEISALNLVVDKLKQDLKRLQTLLISMSQLLSTETLYDI